MATERPSSLARRDGKRPLVRHLTRIVATVGPTSRSPEMIERMIGDGVDTFRLNFSHGSHEEHGEVFHRIRTIAARMEQTISILQDISGPKLRVGVFADGGVVLKSGDTFRLWKSDRDGDATGVGIVDTGWYCDVRVGHRVMLGDGIVILEVTGCDADALTTRVTAGGEVRSRHGLNLPDTDLDIGAVTVKDWRDIDFGLALGVDAIALSFVQGPDDLIAVRRVIGHAKPAPVLIAKIELPNAVRRIESILDHADGIMIARGDLGITLPIEHLPVVQKQLIQAARLRGKFTITATQMLESMTHNQRPTRAEASDVANAVFDGTDAVMLSGETAIGDHPDLVIRTMAEILRHSEPYCHFEPLPSDDDSIDSSMARAVKDLVYDLDARAVIVPVTNGSTVIRISRQRGPVPIVVGLRDEVDARRLNFYTAVFPKPDSSPDNMLVALDSLIQRAIGKGWLRPGDVVVVAGGYPLERTGVTNFIRAHVVGDPL